MLQTFLFYFTKYITKYNGPLCEGLHSTDLIQP